MWHSPFNCWCWRRGRPFRVVSFPPRGTEGEELSTEREEEHRLVLLCLWSYLTLGFPQIFINWRKKKTILLNMKKESQQNVKDCSICFFANNKERNFRETILRCTIPSWAGNTKYIINWRHTWLFLIINLPSNNCSIHLCHQEGFYWKEMT